MKTQSKINQLKVGTIISYLRMSIQVFIGLAYTPVMIRLLGQSEYGLYNMVSSTIAMLSVLRLGFNNSYIRYYSIYKKNADIKSIEKLNGLFLSIFTCIGMVALVCGLFLANNLTIIFSTGLDQREYSVARVLMLLLVLNLSISFPMSVFENIISAHEKFIFLKCMVIIQTVLGPLVTLPLLLMGYRSIAMVVVTVVVSIIVNLCHIWYVLVVLKNRFVFSKPQFSLFKDLFIYTSFIAIELIVDQINWNIDKVILARYKGTVMVAIYSVGYNLYMYYQTFSLSISGVFTPRIHKIVNANTSMTEKRRELTDLFTRVGRIQFLVLALISSGIVFFGKYFIVRIWAGKGYDDSYIVAVLLILTVTIELIQNLGIEIQRAEFKHQFRSITYFFMAILNLIISVILCQRYGAIGSAIGTAISFVVANGIIMNIYYHKQCNIDMIYFWNKIGKLSLGLIVPIVIGIGFVYVVPPKSLIVYMTEIVVYVLIYTFSMWKIGMNEYEKNLFSSLILKILHLGRIK